MRLANDSEAANTQTKLRLIEEQIAKARRRPQTAERDVSIRSLIEMAEQLRNEIKEYEQSHQLA